MNGYPAGTTPYDYGASSLSPPASSPNSKTMADAYRRGVPNGFDKDAPRFNPASSDQAERMGRVDLKDPSQVHLLTETALSDSKGYEILTQEEVDEMKKQSQLLSQRVESTRANLAIQSKYRDAAVSMAKLWGPGGANGAHQGDPSVMDAEREREACERRCEELAAELFNLEKRPMGPQRRLLEHTAGILQLTHRASRRNALPQNGQLMNGIPGSPESLYTYSHNRNSLEQAADEHYLDDPSLYQLDSLDGIQTRGLPRKNAIEIPMKSPIREQNQLRGEMDRVREENMQLRGQTDMLIKKLQGLNVSLRETIVRFNPEVNNDYLEPPSATAAQDAKPAALLKSQVEYLESGLVAVQAEQESFAGGREIGERLESLNLQVRDLLMSSDPHYTPTPIPPGSDVQGQLAYLEDSLRLADSQLGRALSRGGQDGETGPVLTSLWDSIQNGFVEARMRKDERRRARVDKGVPDEDDMSEDEGFDAAEPYSLASFSSRVQWLHSQASTLKDQKYMLKRQIKQQRELNNKPDAEKDEEIGRRQEELEQTRQLLARAERDAMSAQTMLSEALQDLESAKGSIGAAEAAQAELQKRNAKIDALETKLRDVQTNLAAAEAETQGAGQRLANVDSRIASLTQEKAAAEETAQSLRKELEEKTATLSGKNKAMKVKEDELELLNMTLAELKTEVTIARAELDGAYGSRAERAADVAALKNGAEVQRLQNQVEKLKKELGETVQELEGITKETIGAEREKVELEAKLDEALSAKAALDAEMQNSREKMAKLQEELDGERLKVGPGHGNGARPGAGASMLSEQFRATLREERKKFQEDLREERTRCRRLEEELSRLKRSQGPGKSPLSPR
ncbi:hypothetical protein TOPH_01124 [Tolypocladium ophioglossoides CBS 100239]|uniref:Uncharacterized protein n=1 Tax=Tolypocladium ophioglossoides (strain CBS 100239) TaxID=1163406 RepID=A0A0L0NK95_TOLOC|nr:hypothetical protein TOPH_01124 [Tolypocladium ophioglossoides CBS 100239]